MKTAGEDLGMKHRLRPRGPKAAGLGLAVTVAVLSGCTNPFAEMEGDRGQRAPLQRVREIRGLDPSAFRQAAVVGDGAAPAAAGNVGGESRARGIERPAGRLAPADQSAKLSLQEVRAEAIANNLDVQAALVDPTIAGEALNAEAAKFEAVFRPSVRYQDQNLPTFQTTNLNQQKSLVLDAAVDVPLRQGGRITVDYLNQRNETPSAFASLPTAYSSGLSFSLTQPLLRGAGRDVNVASIRIAGYNEQIASARTKLQVVSQLARADRAYWQLYAARKELEVRQQQFELAQAQLDAARRRLRAGDAAEVDVTRAESGLASRLEAIIIAENSVLQAQRELKRLVNKPGLGVDSDQTVLPASDPEVYQLQLDATSLLEIAMDQRMELLEVETQMLADAVSEDAARNAILPVLDLSGSVGFAGLGRDWGRSNRQTAEADFTTYSVGLGAQIPIGNEAAEAQLRRAVLVRLQRLTTREARRQVVRQDVLDAIDRVGAGWQRISAARQAVVLAARTLQAEQRQFEVGNRTSTDVLDAAARLADAQSSEIRALTDYQIAQVDLAVATGTTLGAGKIEWLPRTK